MQFDLEKQAFVGHAGALQVPQDDELARRVAMLVEGECEGLGPTRAAEKFGFSRQRYSQLRTALQEKGILALVSKKRGPKSNYRRTEEAVRQVIRHRFLDPDASVEVIAQKLQQTGVQISVRSVERVIEQFGLQKKTASVSSPSASHD